MLLVAMMAMTGCAAAPDDRSEDPSAIAEPDAQPESPSTALDVPETLRITPAAASCSSQHGSCLGRNLCIANDGKVLTASGCASGTVCCRFNQCLNAGGGCTTAMFCRANGVNLGLPGCATGQVCCELQ